MQRKSDNDMDRSLTGTGHSVSPPLGEESYRLMVESVTDYAILLLDAQGIIRSWNRGARDIKGYTAEEIIGQHFSRFYPPERAKLGWPDHELEVARAEGHFEDEGWRIRKDGSRFWANVVITALRNQEGDLVGYSKITRDLTARRAHAESLRQSEEGFRLLVEGVKDYSIFLLSPQGIISSWNSGAEHIHGYAAEEMVGQHFSRFYPEEAIKRGWPDHELAVAKIEGSFEEEGWRIRKDGSRFLARVNIRALHDADGQFYGFAKITRDLTEHKRVEALELAEQRMNEFLAMLSHELRNPLAPIRSALSVMQLTPPDDPAQSRSRAMIERQVTHITRLVDDLVDVSRVTSGTINLEREPVDVAEVLLRAVESSMPLIEARGHRLEQRLPDERLLVTGDVIRLTQVILNLLNNAAKYTADGGDILLSAKAAANKVIIRVRDTGQGIPAKLIPDIFSLFAQGERTLDRTDGGLGIGLTLARRLVEMQGGSIHVSSKGPGCGSEFAVYLPLLAREPIASPAPQAPRSDEATPTSHRSLRILVVEDMPDVAEGMEMILKLWGHQVQVVCDGDSALEQALGYQPDVVLLDIGLPGMSGYEVAQELRQLPQLSQTTLIALTGYGQQADRNRAFEAGFDHHLVKGGSLEGLKEVLCSC